MKKKDRYALEGVLWEGDQQICSAEEEGAKEEKEGRGKAARSNHFTKDLPIVSTLDDDRQIRLKRRRAPFKVGIWHKNGYRGFVDY